MTERSFTMTNGGCKLIVTPFERGVAERGTTVGSTMAIVSCSTLVVRGVGNIVPRQNKF